jgi:hypothetical protein
MNHQNETVFLITFNPLNLQEDTAYQANLSRIIKVDQINNQVKKLNFKSIAGKFINF